jgi:hypothetical protein
MPTFLPLIRARVPYLAWAGHHCAPITPLSFGLFSAQDLQAIGTAAIEREKFWGPAFWIAGDPRTRSGHPIEQSNWRSGLVADTLVEHGYYGLTTHWVDDM